MTKKFLTIAILTALFLNSCKETTKQESTKNTEQIAETKKVVFGTYQGTTPGANSLIKETLTLNKDNTFVKITVYIDKGNKEFTDKGTYKIVGGNVVLNIDHEREGGYYKVFDGYILGLDINGKEITGEIAAMYKMKKIK
jgi:uncharacterized lipoprotein NlpE involved in copper resistance